MCFGIFSLGWIAIFVTYVRYTIVVTFIVFARFDLLGILKNLNKIEDLYIFILQFVRDVDELKKKHEFSFLL